MDYVYYIPLIIINLFFIFIIIYYLWFSVSLQWTQRPYDYMMARILNKTCNCKLKSAKQNVCLRMVYRLDSTQLDQLLINDSTKIKFIFCTSYDNRLFLLPIMAQWLIDTNFVRHNSLFSK